MKSIKQWELPEIEGFSSGMRSASNNRPLPKTPTAPTVEEIEAMQHQARTEAAREGYVEGLEQGIAEGKKQGYTEGQRKGYEDGFEAAYAEGLEKGQREGQASLAPQMTLLTSMIAALEQPFAAIDVAVREEIVSLTMAMARMVIKREIHAQPEQIMDLVPQLLDMLPSASKQVRIMLHPDDLGYVQGLFVGHEPSSNIVWQEDGAIERGGCRIQSEHSTIDATIEARLEVVFAQLIETQKTFAQHHGSS